MNPCVTKNAIHVTGFEIGQTESNSDTFLLGDWKFLFKHPRQMCFFHLFFCGTLTGKFCVSNTGKTTVEYLSFQRCNDFPNEHFIQLPNQQYICNEFDQTGQLMYCQLTNRPETIVACGTNLSIKSIPFEEM